jgi:hypothetical protein
MALSGPITRLAGAAIPSVLVQHLIQQTSAGLTASWDLLESSQHLLE